MNIIRTCELRLAESIVTVKKVEELWGPGGAPNSIIAEAVCSPPPKKATGFVQKQKKNLHNNRNMHYNRFYP